MSNKSYGLAYERKRKKMLEEQHYTANRNRGSFGGFDIVACNKEHFLLESIKSSKHKYYPPKEERENITKFANAPKGTLLRLVVFERGKMRIVMERVI